VKPFVLYVVLLHPVSDLDQGLLYRRAVYRYYDTQAECDRHIDEALHQYKIKAHRPSMLAGCMASERLSTLRITIAPTGQ
jgi:hypothetical protein